MSHKEEINRIWAAMPAALCNEPFVKSLYEAALAATKSEGVAREQSEAKQRERMNERFANRKPSPATADFDLPAPNDVVEVVAAPDNPVAEKVGGLSKIATLHFLTDVVTAAGLLSHGKTDKGLANRISAAAYELRRALTAPLPSEGAQT